MEYAILLNNGTVVIVSSNEVPEIESNIDSVLIELTKIINVGG